MATRAGGCATVRMRRRPARDRARLAARTAETAATAPRSLSRHRRCGRRSRRPRAPRHPARGCWRGERFVTSWCSTRLRYARRRGTSLPHVHIRVCGRWQLVPGVLCLAHDIGLSYAGRAPTVRLDRRPAPFRNGCVSRRLLASRSVGSLHMALPRPDETCSPAYRRTSGDRGDVLRANNRVCCSRRV